MNAYFVGSKTLDVTVDTLEDCVVTEPMRICELAFAESPGQAKSAFLWYHKGEVEFLDIAHCIRVAKGIDHPAGIAKRDDPLWNDAWDRAFKACGLNV